MGQIVKDKNKMEVYLEKIDENIDFFIERHFLFEEDGEDLNINDFYEIINSLEEMKSIIKNDGVVLKTFFDRTLNEMEKFKKEVNLIYI